MAVLNGLTHCVLLGCRWSWKGHQSLGNSDNNSDPRTAWLLSWRFSGLVNSQNILQWGWSSPLPVRLGSMISQILFLPGVSTTQSPNFDLSTAKPFNNALETWACLPEPHYDQNHIPFSSPAPPAHPGFEEGGCRLLVTTTVLQKIFRL